MAGKKSKVPAEKEIEELKKPLFDLDKGQRNFASVHLMNAGYGSLATMSLSQILVKDRRYWILLLGLLIYAACWRVSLELKRGTE